MSTSRQSRRPGKQQRRARSGHAGRRQLFCCELYCDICGQWWTEVLTFHRLCRQVIFLCPQGHLGALSPCFNPRVPGQEAPRIEDRFRAVGRLRTTDKSWARSGYRFQVANTLQGGAR